MSAKVFVNVGMVVVTSPANQVVQLFRTILPTLSECVRKTLYVHLLPGVKKWPPEPEHLDGKKIVVWSHLLEQIYGHSSTMPDLDLRILLRDVKETSYSPLISLGFNRGRLHTHQKIEAVFFDAEADSDFYEQYVRTSFHDDDLPEVIPLNAIADYDAVVDELQLKPPGLTDTTYDHVVLGGTFDRLHGGHKILLSEALLRCRSSITVGVTDGDRMLKNKVLRELIQPLEIRTEAIRAFVTDVDPNIRHCYVVPISDPLGPAGTSKQMQLIVCSEETKKGCDMVNEAREAKSLQPLHVHVVPLAVDECHDGHDVGNGDDDKISGTSVRVRLLGSELRAPKNFGDKTSGPYLIGLTGGICSGKSSIAKYLHEKHKAMVFDCDKLGHEAYLPGTDCHQKIVDSFGTEILSESDGQTINRAALGKVVFGSKSKREQLNKIVWPEILKLLEQKLAGLQLQEESLPEHERTKVVVVEAAVLLQAGWDERVHQVWTSFVSREEAAKRLMERNGKTLKEAQDILDSQMPVQEMIGLSNVVFCSKWEVEKTRAQVDKAWRHLMERYIDV